MSTYEEKNPHLINYDRAVNLFSPDGRLLQIEYAKEAVNRGGTTIAMKFQTAEMEGIIVGITRFSSPLWELDSREKIHVLFDRKIFGTSCGIIADSNFLFSEIKRYLNEQDTSFEQIPSIFSLANYVANMNHYFTTIAGFRPLGVTLLIFGIDVDGQMRIFEVDPSGVPLSTKVSILGKNRDKIIPKMISSYRPNLTLEEAKELIKSFIKPSVKEHVYVDFRILLQNRLTREIQILYE